MLAGNAASAIDIISDSNCFSRLSSGAAYIHDPFDAGAPHVMSTNLAWTPREVLRYDKC
jgi:hypothetical protein